MSNHWYCTACSTRLPDPLISVVASEATHVCVYYYGLSERSLQLAARLPMGTNTKIQINPLTLKKIGSAAA